jgi:hypothetical protein
MKSSECCVNLKEYLAFETRRALVAILPARLAFADCSPYTQSAIVTNCAIAERAMREANAEATDERK